MNRLSSKPTVYLVDGSNFSPRYSGGGSGSEDDFVSWLEQVSRTESLRASCFRVVFDGPCRRSGPAGPAITIYYSDSEPADEMLVERGYYLHNEGIRAVIVTSDNGLRERAAAEGIKVMSCESFLRLAQAELKKGER